MGSGKSQGQFLARNGLRNLDRQCPLCPDLPDEATHDIPTTHAIRVIFRSANNSDAWLSGHKTIEDLFAIRLNPGRPQSFFDQRTHISDRTSLTEEGVFEPLRMHLYSAELTIQNACARKQGLDMNIRSEFWQNIQQVAPTLQAGATLQSDQSLFNEALIWAEVFYVGDLPGCSTCGFRPGQDSPACSRIVHPRTGARSTLLQTGFPVSACKSPSGIRPEFH